MSVVSVLKLKVLLPDCYVHLIAGFLRNRTFREREDVVLSQEEMLAYLQEAYLNSSVFDVR